MESNEPTVWEAYQRDGRWYIRNTLTGLDWKRSIKSYGRQNWQIQHFHRQDKAEQKANALNRNGGPDRLWG